MFGRLSFVVPFKPFTTGPTAKVRVVRPPDVLGTKVSQTYRATLHGSEEFPVFKSGILLAFRRAQTSTACCLRVLRVLVPALLRVRPGNVLCTSCSTSALLRVRQLRALLRVQLPSTTSCSTCVLRVLAPALLRVRPGDDHGSSPC